MHKQVKWLVVVVMVAAGACTTTKVERWKTLPNSPVDAAYEKPYADFGIYRRLYAAPFEIYYPSSIGTPDPADLERIRAIFRDAFRNAIGDDYEFVTEAAPDVLKVRGSLVDFRIAGHGEAAQMGGRLQDMVHAGHMTFMMELIDSTSEVVLARAADEEKSSPGGGNPNQADWEAVEQAAQRWAGLFRDFIDRRLAKS